MSNKCPKCGSIRIIKASEDVSICLACESLLNTINSKSKPTLFNRITQSPEVLAENLVYSKEEKIRCVGTDHRYEYHMTYGSVLLPGITFEEYGEAFIKTLDKLNEVVDAEN